MKLSRFVEFAVGSLSGILLVLNLAAAESPKSSQSDVPQAEPNPAAASDTGPIIALGRAGDPDVTERHFDRLVVGNMTFTNVWVNRQTNFNILIRHEGGIYTLKLTDLPKKELDALKPQLGDLASVQGRKEPRIVSKYVEFQTSDAYQAKVEEQAKNAVQLLKALILPLAGVLVVLHFLSSFYIYSICRKTKMKPGWEVWFPVVNLTALMRAAGLSGVWALLGFMAMLIPPAVFTYELVPAASVSGFVVVAVSGLFLVASGVVWIVWCFKICIAREKNGWLGILLLLPGVNLITLTYLAFAD